MAIPVIIETSEHNVLVSVEKLDISAILDASLMSDTCSVNVVFNNLSIPVNNNSLELVLKYFTPPYHFRIVSSQSESTNILGNRRKTSVVDCDSEASSSDSSDTGKLNVSISGSRYTDKEKDILRGFKKFLLKNKKSKADSNDLRKYLKTNNLKFKDVFGFREKSGVLSTYRDILGKERFNS